MKDMWIPILISNLELTHWRSSLCQVLIHFCEDNFWSFRISLGLIPWGPYPSSLIKLEFYSLLSLWTCFRCLNFFCFLHSDFSPFNLEPLSFLYVELSGGEDYSLRIWSIRSGKLLFEKRLFSSFPLTLCTQTAEGTTLFSLAHFPSSLYVYEMEQRVDLQMSMVLWLNMD